MENEEIKDQLNQDIQQETADNNNDATENTETTNSFEEQLATEKDKFLRLFAEFENFRKRTARERLELFATASEDVMKGILPVLDDFDRAIAQMENLGASDHLTGFNLISTKLRDNLSSKGLNLVEINAGDIFDADIAEAVTQIPAGDDMKGKVVDVIEKGYKLGDKIIRFPKVVIGQ
ncbi:MULTISPECIES: nucleotide exchange factor GrpE [unclassified Flavobacterium]|uniref:nucleotide exchange factor GrpE n=1 Tax=unclassified Flavobacterium TaxID=196869 RepID=UPI0013D52B9C|nr:MULTISPECIES: nucleotide exchange factor GrpE [unclassified Flavobacterium]MBA5792514.1 nucleotide exchange factor GrpE [Flavobacterium sp. xlx-221]